MKKPWGARRVRAPDVARRADAELDEARQAVLGGLPVAERPGRFRWVERTSAQGSGLPDHG